MCIIAIKNKGVKLPTKATITTMFVNNPDGAGFMYVKHGQVHIEKGFMSKTSFLKAIKAIKNVENIPLIMHFRIGTHGGNIPSNCHPFPVIGHTGKMKALKETCTLGIAHNGIIPDCNPTTGISDTMQYIAEIVAPLRELKEDFYLTALGRRLLLATSKSKLVLLDKEGRIVTVGDFKEGKDKILYSNSSYKESLYSYGAWFSSNDDYENDYFTTSKYKAPKNNVYLMPIPNGSFIDMGEGTEYEVNNDCPYFMSYTGQIYGLSETNRAYPLQGKPVTPEGLPVLFKWNKYCKQYDFFAIPKIF